MLLFRFNNFVIFLYDKMLVFFANFLVLIKIIMNYLVSVNFLFYFNIHQIVYYDYKDGNNNTYSLYYSNYFYQYVTFTSFLFKQVLNLWIVLVVNKNNHEIYYFLKCDKNFDNLNTHSFVTRSNDEEIIYYINNFACGKFLAEENFHLLNHKVCNKFRLVFKDENKILHY